MRSELKAKATNSVTGTVLPLHDSPNDEVAAKKAALVFLGDFGSVVK